MNFIEKLPKSSGKDCIMVVVDRLSKYAHFIPLTHPFTAITVAQTFLDSIYKLHGVPTSIVSDRDSLFEHLLEGTLSLFRQQVEYVLFLPSSK